MRIVNVLPDPRHYSYASTSSGGKTLKPGEIGPELPLDIIHSEVLWKDIAANKVQIILSDNDKSLIAKYLEEGSRELVFQKRATVPKPAKKKPKEAKKSPPSGAPTALPAKPEVKSKPVTPEGIKNGTISLSDLAHSNSVGVPVMNAKSSAMQDIRQHMGGLV